MPASIPTLPTLTPEELATWANYGDARYKAFTSSLFHIVMKVVGEDLANYGSAPYYFGDDDVDFIGSNVDLVAAATHLHYEGTVEDLSNFLFSTDINATQAVYPLCQLACGGGAIYTDPLHSLLKPYLDRIDELETEADRN